MYSKVNDLMHVPENQPGADSHSNVQIQSALAWLCPGGAMRMRIQSGAGRKNCKQSNAKKSV
jgi:hypothetical protein